MSINDTQTILVRVKSFDEATGNTVVIDKEGFEYIVIPPQLGPEFDGVPPKHLEILEAVVIGPGKIGRVSDPKTERIRFGSVGANPDGDAIAQERGRRLEGGRPDTGFGGGQPHDGKFSHPRG